VYSIAATKLSDLLKATSLGETVNVHVVQSVREPQPDFDAMKLVIESGFVPSQDGQESERKNREISAFD
jgi:hypothetical protein